MKLNHTQRRELLHLLSLNAYNRGWYSLDVLRLMRYAIDKKSTGGTRIDLVRAIDRAMGYEVFICLSESNFKLSLEFVCDLLPVGMVLDKPVVRKTKGSRQQLAKALPGTLDQFEGDMSAVPGQDINAAVAAICRREGWPGWGEVNEMCEPNEKAAKAMREAGVDFEKKEKG